MAAAYLTPATKVILATDLPEGMLKPFTRLTVERLTELKSDIEHSLDALIDRVRRLEADGWKVTFHQGEIDVFHPDLQDKEGIEKRLAQLNLSHWEGVLVE